MTPERIRLIIVIILCSLITIGAIVAIVLGRKKERFGCNKREDFCGCGASSVTGSTGVPVK